jgi:hypothetical protein
MTRDERDELFGLLESAKRDLRVEVERRKKHTTIALLGAQRALEKIEALLTKHCRAAAKSEE